MRIGIPSETKTLEGRVALIPAAAADLVRRGHEVFIQSGAGLKSGFADEAYAREGITVVADAAALYEAGRIHHAGCFAELEDQMCHYDGCRGAKSPDRMDALVWALADLFASRRADPKIRKL